MTGHPFVPSSEGTFDRCVARVRGERMDQADARLCGRAKSDQVHDVANLEAAMATMEPVPTPEWAFDKNDMPEDLSAAVYQAVGGASACWENLRGAGVFWDSKARDVAEALIGWIKEHYEEVLDGIPRAELVHMASDSHEAHTIASQAADNLRAGIAEALGYRPEELNRPGDVELLAELKRRGVRPGGGEQVPGAVQFGPSGGMSAP